MPLNFSQVVGPHPIAPHPFGVHLAAADEHSDHGVPHRILNDRQVQPDELTAAMKQWIITHHISPEAIERDRTRREALARQGFTDTTQRFPANPDTQKGNWAEILLAEYLVGSCNANLPVYRLRYNTNVDQSMKGDDVLAFDLDSNPVRVLVGEAKFRSTPSKQAVEEIVEALTKSYRAGIPVSLQFVADRLFSEGSTELGKKVDGCNLLFALGRLRLDHVGLSIDFPAPFLNQRHAFAILLGSRKHSYFGPFLRWSHWLLLPKAKGLHGSSTHCFTGEGERNVILPQPLLKQLKPFVPFASFCLKIFASLCLCAFALNSFCLRLCRAVFFRVLWRQFLPPAHDSARNDFASLHDSVLS
jgi:hypothetical protein